MNQAREPLLVEPLLVERVWGGTRFAGADVPIGEVWMFADLSVVRRGPGAGGTLVEAVSEFGKNLIGSAVWNRGERSFPMLIKLIDVAEWLSIQVHPNDDQAKVLEGSSERGKTEAWFVIDSEPNAEIIAGVRPGIDRSALERAIRLGSIEPLLLRHRVEPHDTIFIPAGTLHALGPGTFVYEIQQNSEITYRAFDWNRPATAGRKLHIEQTAQVSDPNLHVTIHRPKGVPEPGIVHTLTTCEYFRLSGVQANADPTVLRPAGRSCHCVTALDGAVEVSGTFGTVRLEPLLPALIPAAIDEYSVTSSSGSYLLVGSVD